MSIIFGSLRAGYLAVFPFKDAWISRKFLRFVCTVYIYIHVRELFSPLQVYFSLLNLSAILNMLEGIFQASFSSFLKEIQPGTWIPLRVFVQRDLTATDRKWFSIWFTATQNRLKRLLIHTKSKGRKEETIGRVFEKLILVKLSWKWIWNSLYLLGSKFARRQRRWRDLFARKPWANPNIECSYLWNASHGSEFLAS